MIPELLAALSVLASNFQWVLLGTLYGMFLGALPGLGGTVTLALLVPLTVGLDPVAAFLLIGSAWGGTTYGGSVSAITINTPGTGSNAATLIDGYPLTRQGNGSYALGASAAASAAGALVAITLFIILIPIMADLVLAFGVSEYFWIIVIGISVIPLITGENIVGGLIAACLGVLLSLVGTATSTGEARFTLGQSILLDGFDFISILIGLFAIAEIIRLATTGEDIIPDDADGGAIASEARRSEIFSKFDGVMSVFKNKYLFIRSAVIGLFIGIIPGVGGETASFISYAQARETSANPDSFGSGAIEGVIAPEAANDAKDGGQLFPTLGLGIPGSSSAAVVIGALMLHGVTPSTRMLTDNIEVVLLIALALLCSNILTSTIGYAIADRIIWLLDRSSLAVLYPMILVMSIIGTYTIRNNIFDVFVAVIFGVIGFYLMIVGVSRIPILIAFILGNLAEENFYLALQINDYSYVQAFFTGWINIALIVILCIVIGATIYRQRKSVHAA